MGSFIVIEGKPQKDLSPSQHKQKPHLYRITGKEQKRDVMNSQKLNFRNYGFGWHIQKEEDEKRSLAKSQPVRANW